MGGLFKRIEAEAGVFKDERALMPEYLPDVLPHREREVKEIALAVQGAAAGRKPENVILLGPSGTGKTSCVKHVFKELAEYSKKAAPVYINCWEFASRHAVLSMTAQALGEILPRRGIATDEILEKIVEVIKREKRVPVIALDELDRLLAAPHEESRVLYDLARARETFGVDIGLIGITNNENFMAELDARVRSSLGSHALYFKPYSPAELKDILRERAKLAFFDGSVEADAIGVCAAHAAKNGGDARIAIDALWRAGREAEKEGAKKVGVAHVKKAVSGGAPQKAEKMEVMLSEIEEKILALLGKKGEAYSGDIYKAFGENDRTVRNYLAKLEKSGFIESRLVESKEEMGSKGKTRAFRLVKRQG